jgi:hypothetical protein
MERQQVHFGIQRLRSHIAAAIVSSDPREIAKHAHAARLLARQLRRDLAEIDGFDPPESLQHPAERMFHRLLRRVRDAVGEFLARGPRRGTASISAARRAMDRIIGRTQTIRLGVNVAQMRQALLDCKRHIDFADAHLKVAFA